MSLLHWHKDRRAPHSSLPSHHAKDLLKRRRHALEDDSLSAFPALHSRAGSVHREDHEKARKRGSDSMLLRPLVRDDNAKTRAVRTSQLTEVLSEELDRALVCDLGRLGYVSRTIRVGECVARILIRINFDVWVGQAHGFDLI